MWRGVRAREVERGKLVTKRYIQYIRYTEVERGQLGLRLKVRAKPQAKATGGKEGSLGRVGGAGHGDERVRGAGRGAGWA